ncbi:MAG: 23S rRNA (uracil(1939)-C(5))-methyltransferase RlmD [Clostridia bacterium]|nr:23S rRNA (uracil(1939)-C(5))-methyltransferase RlmD [Clostridia bacterium]
MQIKKNDIIDLEIDNCGLDGSGIGRHDGLAVFVPSAAKGDVIKAHILKVKKNCAFAKIEEILTPSPDRIECPCPVNMKCGGCSFGQISYEAEARIKENHVKECFKRIGGLNPEFEPVMKADKIYGYRNKAQFPVRIDSDDIAIGFYANHSHRVINCPGCLLQPAEFEGILGVFTQYIKKYNVSSYDEESHTGLIRHIYIRKGTASGEIMVCPVINGDSLPGEDELVNMLTASFEGIKSIVINSNKDKTNVILGRNCRTLYGADYITDTLCGLKFRLSPLSFYQVNRDQAEKLYHKAAEYAGLTGAETLLDLYCGTGTIGLTMADKVKKLIGVEIVPQAIEDAKINAAENGIDNARFICADAAEAAKMLTDEGVRPDIIILDPPRKGCSPELINTAASMNPQRIVYVSCDPATLARDCRLFDELGYKAVKATPADLFPRTGHVETVVLMTGKQKNRISEDNLI